MNETVVVDANIALKWVLTESDSQIARALLAEWKKKKTIVYVPTLLTYEVTNILYREVRAGRITSETAQDGINLIFRAVSPVFLAIPLLIFGHWHWQNNLAYLLLMIHITLHWLNAKNALSGQPTHACGEL